MFSPVKLPWHWSGLSSCELVITIKILSSYLSICIDVDCLALAGSKDYISLAENGCSLFSLSHTGPGVCWHNLGL